MKKGRRINEDGRTNKLELQENTCTNCQMDLLWQMQVWMTVTEKKNVAMQTTITSRKETETAKQSPEEKNEVPIF